MPAGAQTAEQPMDSAMQFNESGSVAVAGQQVRYLIRRLPVNSFPQLPAEIAAALRGRGCLIPQTYEAHRPENVIHASLERTGSSDWAVLCSTQGHVALLVFFGSEPGLPMELASTVETKRLQPHGAEGELGFNWGIDPASPDDMDDALTGSGPGGPERDHDGVADSVIEHRTIYHYFSKGRWTVAEARE
ncbi:MAG TPA: hypothetical protein VFU68_04325 [Terracidiphilus sp.]|nr:hypothetical protein [Terracidiphilus sp.]